MRLAASALVILTSASLLFLIWRPRHSAQAAPPLPIQVTDDTPEHREPLPSLSASKRKPRNLNLAALLACIRRYEQGREGYATDTGNGYFGAYQASEALWRAYFGDRRPKDVSPEEQDAMAIAILEHDGGLKAGRWPTPYKRCR